MRTKLPLRQKALLVLFGLVLSLILIEAGMRLAGFALTAAQDSGNLRSLKKDGSYRILCLGESTTQGQYPRFLEEILNRDGRGRAFAVIDEGRAGTATPVILSRAAALLDKYHPDMVVAMMGINDGGARHMPGDAPPRSLLGGLRVHKLARMLELHLSAWAKDLRPGASYTVRGGTLLQQGRLDEAEAAFTKALKADPGNPWSHINIGLVHRAQGRFGEAESDFKTALRLDPLSAPAHDELGYTALAQGHLPQAEAAFGDALRLDPRNERARLGLAGVAIEKGRSDLGEAELMKALEIAPANQRTYIDLAQVSRAQGHLDRAEDWLKKSLEVPGTAQRAKTYGELALLSAAAGHKERARGYHEEARRLAPDAYASNSRITADSYRALKALLDERKIRLVAVQYPMRPIASLTSLFDAPLEGVVFVDNEGRFRDAAGREGLSAYFKDMFAGDFGHCTEKGNRLLAANIAAALLPVLGQAPR